jgi:hypothetical protein
VVDNRAPLKWFSWPYNAAMPRKLIWIKDQKFQGFGCSECQWVFKGHSQALEFQRWVRLTQQE